jgi:hypothetical protein
MRPDVFGKVVGTLSVDPGRYDIGLNLKANGKYQVCAYTIQYGILHYSMLLLVCCSAYAAQCCYEKASNCCACYVHMVLRRSMYAMRSSSERCV